MRGSVGTICGQSCAVALNLLLSYPSNEVEIPQSHQPGTYNISRNVILKLDDGKN